MKCTVFFNIILSLFLFVANPMHAQSATYLDVTEIKYLNNLIPLDDSLFRCDISENGPFFLCRRADLSFLDMTSENTNTGLSYYDLATEADSSGNTQTTLQYYELIAYWSGTEWISSFTEPFNTDSSYMGVDGKTGYYLFAWAVDVDGTSTNTSPVPEPETYAMLLAGLGLLSLTAKRRKQSA